MFAPPWISAPPGLDPIDSIPNPIDLRAWPLQQRKGDHLLWIGRISPERVSGSWARSVDRPSASCSVAPAVLMPIRWDEPFGMVMVEAPVCGTPVIAFPEGAARELVVDGKTGFLVEHGRALAEAIGQLGRIDAPVCRVWVSQHCDVEVVASAYGRIYRSVMLGRTASGARRCLCRGPRSAPLTEAARNLTRTEPRR